MKLLDKDGLTYYTGKIKNELTDYVKFTDYATNSKGGVFRTGGYGTAINSSGQLYVYTQPYTTYQSQSDGYFIGKGTLENVITGKGLINNQVNNLVNYYTKTEIDNTIGNINSALDLLNGEVI